MKPASLLGAPALLAGCVLAWGHFEAGWVRLRKLPVGIEGLAHELAGLRIVHLSDFHLGFPSRGSRAVARAIEWTHELEPDLVLLTGDLLSHPRAATRLRSLLEGLPNCLAVLGNHDFAHSRDPFSRPVRDVDLGAATLLGDEARTLDLRGRRVQIVGADPRSYRHGTSGPEALADPQAELRILLCHFPAVVDRLPAGTFDLVLAGHMHAGQICVPYWGGKLRLSQMNWRYVQGVYRRPAGVLHVSPGLGTTFVPFRFLARPEATELTLQSRGWGSGSQD